MLSLPAAGKVEAHVGKWLPLEEATEALGLLASGKATGKIVLVPGLGSTGNPPGVSP